MPSLKLPLVLYISIKSINYRAKRPLLIYYFFELPQIMFWEWYNMGGSYTWLYINYVFWLSQESLSLHGCPGIVITSTSSSSQKYSHLDDKR